LFACSLPPLLPLEGRERGAKERLGRDERSKRGGRGEIRDGMAMKVCMRDRENEEGEGRGTRDEEGGGGDRGKGEWEVGVGGRGVLGGEGIRERGGKRIYESPPPFLVLVLSFILSYIFSSPLLLPSHPISVPPLSLFILIPSLYIKYLALVLLLLLSTFCSLNLLTFLIPYCVSYSYLFAFSCFLYLFVCVLSLLFLLPLSLSPFYSSTHSDV
jgi:hypothetical protein